MQLINPDKHYLEKELNDLLQKNNKAFYFIEAGSLDGMWYWDLENPEYKWMSSRFWSTLGYNPAEKEHLTSEWQNLIHPDDLKVALNNLDKHCADPKHPYDQVVRYTHKQGHTVWVRCRGIAIRDNNNKPIRMLGAHNDVTDFKQSEIALLAKIKELETAQAQISKQGVELVAVQAQLTQLAEQGVELDALNIAIVELKKYLVSD